MRKLMKSLKHNIKFYFNDSLLFWVCLVGGKIERIENFKEKIERKIFLECIWLGGRKKNK